MRLDFVDEKRKFEGAGWICEGGTQFEEVGNDGVLISKIKTNVRMLGEGGTQFVDLDDEENDIEDAGCIGEGGAARRSWR